MRRRRHVHPDVLRQLNTNKMKLLGFVLGVRVNKSFSIEDKLGAIVDDILNHKNDTFSPDKFPRIRQSFDSRILLNESTGDILQLAPEGVVLEHYVEDSFDDELEVTLNAFEEIIIKGVLKKYKIRNINRIGFMVKSIVEANDEFLDDIIGVISKNYDKPKSLSVRFNTTKNVPQKIEKIVTQDYENLILTYDRPSEDKNFVFSADYQKHFIPPLNIIDDLKRTFDSSFDKFCKRAIKDFRSKYIDDGSQKKKSSIQ